MTEIATTTYVYAEARLGNVPPLISLSGGMTYQILASHIKSEPFYRFMRVVLPASFAGTTVTQLRTLPKPAGEDTYSFEQIMSLLTPAGRDVFDRESRVLDSELRGRFTQGEVSAVYYYRSLARMTQEQLALSAGSRQSYISQIEQGKRPLTLKQARKISVALGVTASQLIEGNEHGG